MPTSASAGVEVACAISALSPGAYHLAYFWSYCASVFTWIHADLFRCMITKWDHCVTCYTSVMVTMSYLFRLHMLQPMSRTIITYSMLHCTCTSEYEYIWHISLFFKRVQSYLDGEGAWLPMGFRQRVYRVPRISKCLARIFLNHVSRVHLRHFIMVPMMYLWNHLGWIYDAPWTLIPYKLFDMYFPIRGIIIIYAPGKNKTRIHMRCAHNVTCFSDIYCRLCATVLGWSSPSDCSEVIFIYVHDPIWNLYVWITSNFMRNSVACFYFI